MHRACPSVLVLIVAFMLATPAWAVGSPRRAESHTVMEPDPAGVLAGGPVHGMALNYPGRDPRIAVPDFERLQADGINTVSVYIAWQTESTTSSAMRPTRHTPSATTLAAVTSAAHAAGLAVEWMPLVLVPGSPRLWWHPTDTTTFWQNYRAMIDSYVTLARDNNVEIFCIGSEYHDLQSDGTQWSALADRVRTVDGYRGLTTYMSAGGMYGVTWWSSVDYIGVSPYYSLSRAAVPSVAALKSAWTSTYLPFLK